MTTLFKCSKCKKEFEETEFNLGKKLQRLKLCKNCDEYRTNWNEEKKKELHFDLKDNENWKLYDGDIYCNKLGQIVNNKTKKMIGAIKKDGYIGVTIKGKNLYVHRIIYETFNEKIPNGMCINHINEIKNDNRIENLEVVTLSENTIKSSKLKELNKNGRRKPKKCFGKKIDADEWIEYKSLSEAERKLNICNRSIQLVCDGITNSATSKTNNEKYIFKY